MNSYTFYLSDGAITANISVPDMDMPEAAIAVGHPYIEGAFNASEYYVDTASKEAVQYTEHELATKNAPPAFNARWDIPSKSWVDVRTAAQIASEQKASLIDEITAQEANQPRAVREALLALINGTASGDSSARLQSIDSAIGALRTKIAATKND